MKTRTLVPEHRRRWFRRALVPLVVLVLSVGICSAAPDAAGRRKMGEDYARGFSNEAQGRRVTWDDRACSFTENSPNTDRPDVATQSTIILAATVTAIVRSRTARAGMLDVTFHCDPPLGRCISHVRRYGSTAVSLEWVAEHTMAIAGATMEAPRVGLELAELRAACLVTRADASP